MSESRGRLEGINSVPRPTPFNRVLSHLSLVFGLLLIFPSDTLHSFFFSFFTSHSFNHGFRRSSSTEISCVHGSARSQRYRFSTKYPGSPPKHFHRTRQHVPDNSNALRPCKSQECPTCVACKQTSLHLLRHLSDIRSSESSMPSSDTVSSANPTSPLQSRPPHSSSP